MPRMQKRVFSIRKHETRLRLQPSFILNQYHQQKAYNRLKVGSMLNKQPVGILPQQFTPLNI